MVILVMGVSGCGKTTVGSLLARRLRLHFLDADDFHEERNIRKMRAGIPLKDTDRKGWLLRIADRITGGKGAVVACSALKESYREILRRNVRGGFTVVYLKGDASLVRERVLSRKNHFFNEKLVESQFAALEEPEEAFIFPITKPPREIVDEIKRLLDKNERSSDVIPERK